MGIGQTTRMSTATATPQYWSAGNLMAKTGLTVPTIRRHLESRGMAPAFYENDVDFYDEQAYLALLAHKTEMEKQ